VALRTAYLRGASGYILVADGTRAETLTKAIDLQIRAHNALGGVPFALVVNKTDRLDDWAMDEAALDDLAARGWQIFRTSAKTGLGVEEVFTTFASRLVRGESQDVTARDR
jgi:GTPase SAR1 family protein